MKKTPRILEPICDRQGQISSMRIVVFVFTFVCAGLIQAVSEYIRQMAQKGATIDWMGLSAFIGAMTALITLLILHKVRQTKIENSHETT